MTISNTVLAAPLRVRSNSVSLAMLSALAIGLLAAGYVMLVLPGASYVEIFLNDVIGLTDAAYRTYLGQVPSVDYPSLYGAAVIYPAALGFHLGYDAGGVLAFGHFLTGIFLLTLAVLACYRRLAPLPAAVFVLFLFLLIMVPLRPGGTHIELTYGIYYTRHGWAGLAIVLLFYLEPRTPGRGDLIRDTIVLSLLLLYLFYLKMTFAAVALAFVVANAVTSPWKLRQSLLSLAAFAIVIGIISLGADYNSGYGGNVARVVEKTPAVRRGTGSMLWTAVAHFDVFLLCATSLGLLFLAGRRRFFDVGFVLGCAGASLMILDQSGGTERGLLALIAPLLVLQELARRTEAAPTHGSDADGAGAIASFAICGLVLVFAAGPMAVGVQALGNYYTRTTEALTSEAPGLAGIYVRAAPKGFGDVHEILHESLGPDERAHEVLAKIRRGELRAWQYLPLLREGVELLKGVPHDDHAVVAFEQTNAFSFALGMRPTARGFPLHYIVPRSGRGPQDRTPEQKEALSKRFFSDANYVMVPTVPYYNQQLVFMQDRYGDYLETHFEELDRSPHWILYARR